MASTLPLSPKRGASLSPLYKSKNAKIERACEDCGRTFFVQFSARFQKACSVQCSRNITRKHDPVPCLHCGESVSAVNGVPKKFCDRECMSAYRTKEMHPLWNEERELTCANCGEVFERGIRRRRKFPMCSPECWQDFIQVNGRSHRAPVGTTRQNVAGYMVVKMEDGSWAQQHRLVMEEHLGRKLERYEVVHHVDGDKAHNDIENLMLGNQSDHMRFHKDAEKIGMKVMSGCYALVPVFDEPCSETEAF